MRSNTLKLALNIVFVVGIILWGKYGNLYELIEHHGIAALHVICILLLTGLSIYAFIKLKRRKWWILLLAIPFSTPSVLFFIENPFTAQFSILYCIGLITLIVLFRSNILHAKKAT
jgi:hypothetical protein